MSFQLYDHVVKHSPFKGTTFYIHCQLAYRADKDGWCWPSQKLLAKEVRCSERQVQRAVKEMATLGLIVVQRDPESRRNSYQVLMPTPMSGPSRHAGRDHDDTHVGTMPPPMSGSIYEPKVEPKVEPTKNNCATSSHRQDKTSPSDVQEDAGMTDEEWERCGVSDEHDGWAPPSRPEPKFKPPAAENTRRRCLDRFHRGAVKVGYPKYDHKLLNKVISQFCAGEGKATRSYSYAEIEKIFDVFFVRYGQSIKSDTTDIVVAFMFFAMRVQKDAADSFAYKTPNTRETLANRWFREAMEANA